MRHTATVAVTFTITCGLLLFAGRRAISAMVGVGETERTVKAAGYARLDETARRGQTVFVGDSITEGYRVTEHLAGYTTATGQLVYNRGISGATSDELLVRWDDVLALEPSRLVLLIGTNDLGRGLAPTTIASAVETMVAKARVVLPTATVILQAVYPTNPRRIHGIAGLAINGRRTADGIATLNRLLEAVAHDHGVHWLNLTADLADAAGALDPAYSWDGLHLTEAGYEIVTRRLLPLLRQSSNQRVQR